MPVKDTEFCSKKVQALFSIMTLSGFGEGADGARGNTKLDAIYVFGLKINLEFATTGDIGMAAIIA